MSRREERGASAKAIRSRFVELRGRVTLPVCRRHLFTHHSVWSLGDLSLVNLSQVTHLYIQKYDVFVKRSGEGDGLIFRHRVDSKRCSDVPCCQGHPSLPCEQNNGEGHKCSKPAAYLSNFVPQNLKFKVSDGPHHTFIRLSHLKHTFSITGGGR